MELDLVLRVLASLERHGVDYALVGATALTVHGIVRATEVVDVFVRPTTGNIDALRRALHAVFEDPSIDEITAQDLMGDYPAVTYVAPDGDFRLDILTRLGDAVRFEDLEIEWRELQGVAVHVATPKTLYRMKRGTVREKDRIDAQMLRLEFGLDEE